MTNKTKKIIGGIVIGLVILLMTGSATDIIPLGGRTRGGGADTTSSYATTTDTLVYSGRCLLERILIWKDGSGGKIAVMDGTNTTSTNVIFELEDDALTGSYEVGLTMTSGIVADITNATTTFIYIPE